jgi:voltage-gated potassium channel
LMGPSHTDKGVEGRPAEPGMTYRRRVHLALYGNGSDGLTWIQRVLVFLILLSLVTTVLGTEAEIVAWSPTFFEVIETILAPAFVLEYLARVWSAPENPKYAGTHGRLRYLVSPLAIVDLLAVAPFVLGFFGAESLVLRMVRLLRFLILAKLVRFSRAIHLLATVVYDRRFELGFTALVAMTVVLISATVLYVVEGGLQPETFGSIPRAMWWAVATLTTVGYGDVYPVTALGRVFGAITAFAGIGLIAMPTGILAAALSDALARARIPQQGIKDGGASQ